MIVERAVPELQLLAWSELWQPTMLMALPLHTIFGSFADEKSIEHALWTVVPGCCRYMGACNTNIVATALRFRMMLLETS